MSNAIDQQLSSDFRGQKNQRRDQITDRDALKDTRNADRREWKIREAVEKQSESKDDGGALDDFEIQVAFDASFLDAPRERECNRNTDDEKEKRKHKIGRRPAI